ncbi:hypothetical protein NQ315_010425 [Exocentrus adspersus]|uniref:COX assembly mitochondrial protein n=1 Tax=Exocentrus adspersus TaxID=1586481 RepID=A0AAV8WB57_9CUCU|nr:hypothetical protein NQ315_010425 [Exocentrus adspersus]
MHTDLSPHLHSEKCNELIQLLQQCRKDYPFLRLFGKCSPEYSKMVKCLKEERLIRRQKKF